MAPCPHQSWGKYPETDGIGAAVRDSNGISEPPFIQLILYGKIGCMRNSLEIQLLTLTAVKYHWEHKQWPCGLSTACYAFGPLGPC